MVRVAVIFGTRPEVIKLSPVIKELEARGVETFIISTSQHQELLELAMQVFKVKPDYDLKVMRENQTLFHVTVQALEGLRDILQSLKPQAVLAQGDTTTVLASALASFYLRIPFGHVEAGLRTGNIWSPYPEEANRQLVARITTWHFAPTKLACENLRRENVPGEIFLTGNTVVDALEMIKPSLRSLDLSERFKVEDRRFVLVEVHRRESFGEPIREIFRAVRDLAREFKELRFLLLVHPNPNVREAVKDIFGAGPPSELGNLTLALPVDYLSMLWLISKARLIITDSGGIQEEAPSFATPVLVVRDHTERPEGIESGFLYIAGRTYRKIVNISREILNDPEVHKRLSERPNPYGDGKASKRIVDVLLRSLREGSSLVHQEIFSG